MWKFADEGLIEVPVAPDTLEQADLDAFIVNFIVHSISRQRDGLPELAVPEASTLEEQATQLRDYNSQSLSAPASWRRSALRARQARELEAREASPPNSLTEAILSAFVTSSDVTIRLSVLE